MLDQSDADLTGWPSSDRYDLAARRRANPSTGRAYGDHLRFRRRTLGEVKGMQGGLRIDPEQGKVGGPIRRDHHPLANIAIGKGGLKGFCTANRMGRAGIAYNALADRLSWAATVELLAAAFEG